MNYDDGTGVQKLSIMPPVVSVITVVFNNAQNISGAIESVLSQSYDPIEYVVIDGGSTDGTAEIINQYKDAISFCISEPDNGIYDALNKGIINSTGKYIAILHSDDLFCDENVVADMVEALIEKNAEFAFSNMVIVDQKENNVIRYYQSNFFSEWLLRIGWMPPHPTCLLERELHDEFGLYNTKYKIAGDYDFFLRIFFGRKIRWAHVNRVTVKMRHGGISNSGMYGKLLIYSEIKKSLDSNGVWSLTVFQVLRYLIRIMELVIRPKDTCGRLEK